MEPSPSSPLSPSRASLARAVDDRGGVAGELVLVEELAHFHLDELQELGVVDHVALVHVDDDVRNTDLAGQEDVLTRLRHGAVGGRHDQDGAVHLGRAGDHVLDVVGVPGAVDVGVVPVLGLVLDVGGVDGDAARLLFGRRVDLVVRLGLAAEQLAQHGRDRRRQRRLAVVDVANGPHVHVRLGPLEFALCHFYSDRHGLAPQALNGCLACCTSTWCPWRGSNARPLPYQGSALPLSHMGFPNRRPSAPAQSTFSLKRTP